MLDQADMKEHPNSWTARLLWLHEQEVIRLDKGLAVFRPAMTMRLAGKGVVLVKDDFAPLEEHYDEQIVQIHVMAEYANAASPMAEASRLPADYFTLDQDAFMGRWLQGRARRCTADHRQSWKAWSRCWTTRYSSASWPTTGSDQRAGAGRPGSGKTRVLVHRIAYLIRVRREDPRSILVLAYNRHAAVEIRRVCGT